MLVGTVGLHVGGIIGAVDIVSGLYIRSIYELALVLVLVLVP